MLTLKFANEWASLVYEEQRKGSRALSWDEEKKPQNSLVELCRHWPTSLQVYTKDCIAQKNIFIRRLRCIFILVDTFNSRCVLFSSFCCSSMPWKGERVSLPQPTYLNASWSRLQHEGEMKLQEPYFLLIFNDSRIFSSFACTRAVNRSVEWKKKHSTECRAKNGNYA